MSSQTQTRRSVRHSRLRTARRNWADVALDAVQQLITDLAAALKPLEDIKRGKPHDVIEYALRHCKTIEALSIDDSKKSLAFDGPDGNALAKAFDELFQSTSAPNGDDKPPARRATLTSLSTIIRMCFQTAFGDRIVRRAAIGNGAASHLRPARSAPHRKRPHHSRRTGRGRVAACAARRSVAEADPCGTSLASICQSGASDCRRMTSRNCVGAERRDPCHARRRSAARQRWRRVSCTGSKPSRARNSGRDAKRRGDNYTRWADELDRPAVVTPAPQADAETRAGAAADANVGDRNRGLAARSVYDLRQAHSQTYPARSGGHAADRRGSRLGDPRGARRIHRRICNDATG